MSLSENLAWALLTRPDAHDIVQRHRYDLQWLGNRLVSNSDDNEPCGRLLRTILEYDSKYGRTPSEQELKDFVSLLIQGYSDPEAIDEIESQLQKMHLRMNNGDLSHYDDVEVMFEALIQKARTAMFTSGCREAMRRANGEKIKVKGEGERPGTVDDGIAFIREGLAKRDYRKNAPQIEGALHENTEEIMAQFERWSKSGQSERIKTGFDHLDNHLVITKKLNPYIGIMGFANDGKSTVLSTMLYNMAMRGKNVLLFTKETDPLQVFIKFVYLHSNQDKYRNEFYLPSLMDYRLGHKTQQDDDNVGRILSDIKNRVGIPGRIEVKCMGDPKDDWEALLAHLNSNHKRYQYDVLGIDYLTRMNIPGDKQWYDKNIVSYIHAAFDLSRNFNKGEGLVVITPVQINKTGYKEAKKKKEGERKHDMTSIHQYSDFFRDMDVLVSIYADDAMKADNKLLMETQKVREGAFPPSVTLSIDRITRYVEDDDAAHSRYMDDYLSGKKKSGVNTWRETYIDQDIASIDVAGGI